MAFWKRNKFEQPSAEELSAARLAELKSRKAELEKTREAWSGHHDGWGSKDADELDRINAEIAEMEAAEKGHTESA